MAAREFRAIRVLVPGSSAVGRAVLRGVMDFAETRRHWRVHASLQPGHADVWQTSAGDAVITAWPRADSTEQIRQRGALMVATLPHFENMGVVTVASDDLAVGRMAAEHFLTRGFTTFVFDSRGDVSLAAQRRYEGFRLEVEAHGLSASRTNPRDSAPPGDYSDLIELLQSLQPPVALFCAHDGIARDAERALADAQLAVPEQVAVLGVDNDDLFCALRHPHLSSIDWPARQCGFLAAQTLEAIIAGLEVPMRQYLLPSGVLTRRSTDAIALSDPNVVQALRHIREHACDPCNIDDVLATMKVSRRWLEKAFKQMLGRSPHDELTRVRLEHARRLLQMTNLPVETVARQSGYPHAQNFVKIFRQKVGLTPGEFRKRHRVADVESVR